MLCEQPLADRLSYKEYINHRICQREKLQTPSYAGAKKMKAPTLHPKAASAEGRGICSAPYGLYG